MKADVLRAAFALALVAAAHGPAFAQDRATLGVGAEYTSGEYGSADTTEIFYLPVTAKYETGRWTLRTVVPYIRMSGPSNVVGAGEDRVTLPGAPTRRTESGLGDIVVSAFYNLVNERSSPIGLDLGAKAKLATADEGKGLGTGENDYSLQADLFKPLGDATAFGSLGYRWYGDPPGVDLRNVFYGSLGVSYRLSGNTSVGVAYDFRPRISPAGGAIGEASAFVSQRLSRDIRLQLYGILGFSSASPDHGIGAALNFGF